MKTWMIVLLICLVLVALIFGGSGAYITNENLTLYKNQMLIPFSQKLDPNNTSYLTEVKDGNGNNQLSCPAGTSINIVGAIYEVMDSYGQCSPSPSDAITASCIPGVYSNVSCDPSKNNPGTGGPDTGSNPGCPSGWTCGSTSNGGMCTLRIFNSQADAASVCPGPNIVSTQDGNSLPSHPNAKYWACTDDNICDANRTQTNGQNPVCNSQTGKGRCAVRDVSAYVAAQCEGKQSCDLDFTQLGPSPCAVNLPLPPAKGGKGCNITIDASGKVLINNITDEYCDLPFSYGFPGGVPSSAGNNGTPSPANFNLGYVVHGLFSCVPN